MKIFLISKLEIDSALERSQTAREAALLLNVSDYYFRKACKFWGVKNFSTGMKPTVGLEAANDMRKGMRQSEVAKKYGFSRQRAYEIKRKYLK